MNIKKQSARRKFLGNIAAGAAALGMLSIPSSIKAAPKLFEQTDDADEWFKKLYLDNIPKQYVDNEDKQFI